jgi:hypothetical protein
MTFYKPCSLIIYERLSRGKGLVLKGKRVVYVWIEKRKEKKVSVFFHSPRHSHTELGISSLGIKRYQCQIKVDNVNP